MNEPIRILLVDDDDTFTGVMSRALVRRGYAVEVAHNGDDALALAAAQRPQFVLLDLNLPGASGLVILPELLATLPAARVIILTGYSSIATAVEAIKLGASNYLCKPATASEVLAAFEDNAAAPAPIPEEPLSVDRLEWEHIQKVLADNDGNITATARALGMHRRTLQRKLQKRPVRK